MAPRGARRIVATALACIAGLTGVVLIAAGATGVVFDQTPRDERWLWREARLRDPSGNTICIFCAGNNRKNPPWRIETAK